MQAVTSCIIFAVWLIVMCFLLWRPEFVCVPVTFGGTSWRSFPIRYRRWMSKNAIVKHIDSVLSKADAVIADKKAQLATLDEYIKSLIFEYVTGKKEVPCID